MNKKQLKDAKTVIIQGAYIRSSVKSKLYSVFGELVWFKHDELEWSSPTEIEIKMKLAKKKFPNETF